MDGKRTGGGPGAERGAGIATPNRESRKERGAGLSYQAQTDLLNRHGVSLIVPTHPNISNGILVCDDSSLGGRDAIG